MAAPTTAFDLDRTIANNQPPSSEGLSSGDDQIRALAGILKQVISKGSDIASAATITPDATAAMYDVTGTTGITAIGSTNSWDGRIVWLQFDGALTITHASTLKLPGAVNYTTAAGDVLAFVQETSGTWRCVSNLKSAYQARFYANGSTAKVVTGDYTTYTEVYDSGSNFASGVFTAPYTGLYQFNGTFNLSATTAGLIKGSINRNGGAIANFGSTVNGTNSVDVACSVSYYLAAGDTVNVAVNTLTGTDAALIAQSFDGYLVSR
jgi:hypothetical protein